MFLPKTSIYLSIASGLLMAASSLFGIIDKNTYAKESLNWAAQAIGQDYINLFIVFPVLLFSSIILLRKESLKALLVWLGALFYIIYSYILYSFFVHFGFLFPVYIAALSFAFYAFIGGIIYLSRQDILSRFSVVRVKMMSILLGVIASLFFLLWLSDIFGALIKGTLPNDLDKIGLMVNPVHVLDMAFLLPGALVTSFMVWRKKYLGFIFAIPFAIFFILMGLAIVSMMMVLSQNGFALAVPQMIAMVVVVIISLITVVRFSKDIS